MISEVIALLDPVAGITTRQAISLESVLDDEQQSLQLPVWYVHPLQERAGGNQISTLATRQSVEVQFVVITVCTFADLPTWRDELFGALHGKVLDTSRHLSETEFLQGDVVDVTATAIWWRDVFSYRIERRTSGV